MNIIKTSPFIIMTIGFIFCPVKYYNFLDQECSVEDDNNLFIYGKDYISSLYPKPKVEVTNKGKIKKFEMKVPAPIVAFKNTSTQPLNLDNKLKDRLEKENTSINNEPSKVSEKLNLIFEYELKIKD